MTTTLSSITHALLRGAHVSGNRSLCQSVVKHGMPSLQDVAIADILARLKNKPDTRYVTLHFYEKSAPIGALFIALAADDTTKRQEN